MQGSIIVDVAGTWLTAEDRQLLRQPEVAGIILFARNIESPAQVRDLCRSVRQVRADLLITVDQEGGRVQRLRRDTVALPAMGRLGELAFHSQTSVNPAQAAEQLKAVQQLATACGWLMATEVLNAGIDFSFAPVLDVDYGRSQVIGARGFAHTPEQVTPLADAFIQGMAEAGMPAVGKHFPGHGWAEADSHVAIPYDERSLEQISQSDLQPFAQLAPRLAGVMPAHVIYPQVDTQPAGFSSVWLQQVLRQQLGFTGVIFSDDLGMAGAQVAGGAAERVAAALGAGCDVGLVCNDRSAAEQALSFLQQNAIAPCSKLAALQGRYAYNPAYRQAPRWQQAVTLLRTAQLI
ncbi:beta-hexosaminidase [Thiopseudomonas alkaliphila]|nr:beta-hexosaminidase [Thiopseudomonas alkaliphila]